MQPSGLRLATARSSLRLLAFSFAVFATLSRAAPAQTCTTILDAGNTIGPYPYLTNHVQAQTFTPTVSGTVCEIQHGLEPFGLPSYDVYVVSAPGTGAPPTNYTSVYLFRALAQTSFSTAGGGGINGKVTVTGLTVTAGVRYALVIVPTGGLIAWRGHLGNPYGGGQGWWGLGGGWVPSQVSDFTFRVFGPAGTPNNDPCASCRSIGLGTVTGTTVGATTDGSSSCGGTNDVWYCFRARCSGQVIASVCNPAFDSVLSVHTGCPGTSLNQIVCNDDCGGNPCIGPGSCVTFNAVCGVTYRIRVATIDGFLGAFSLTLTQAASTPPPNNNQASATVIGNVTNLAFSTCGATTDGPASCAIHNDIWYRYTPPCQGTVTVDTCGSFFDTYIAVYTGTPGSLTQVAGACNDDNGPACPGLQASLQFTDVLCTTYYIRVGGWGGDFGCGDLTITCSPTIAVNDTCSGAIPIGPGITYGTTIGATASLPATLLPPPCGVSANTADVWYSYTPPCNGQLRLETCPLPCVGNRYDTVVGVYQGGCSPPLLQVPFGCNDDANCGTGYSLSSRVIVNVTGCINYKIRVSGYAGRIGNFALQLTFVPAPPPSNDNICNALPALCGAPTTFTTCGATTSPQASTCPFNNDVWFRFTATCGGLTTFATCNSACLTNTVLAVYSGTCNAPVEVACNDDASPGTACQFTQWSVVSFLATANTTYWVRVGSPVAGASGNGILTITCPSPGACSTGPTGPSVLFDISGFASNTSWNCRITVGCCADLCVTNVPGVPTTGNQDQDEDALRDQFVMAINNALAALMPPCPLLAVSHPFGTNGETARGKFSIKGRHCGTNNAPQLWVGPAGPNCNSLSLVTTLSLPTTGAVSFNPSIYQVELSGVDCNRNGEDDYMDILLGTSQDVNRNGVPDECDLMAARAVSFGVSCPASSATLDLKGTLPVIGSTETITLDGGSPGSLAFLVMATRAPVPFPLFANCLVYINVTQLIASFPLPILDARGHTELSFGLPNNPALQGLDLAVQSLASDAASPIGFGLSNAVQLILGF